MKLENRINIEELARQTLKNILSSKGIIYRHYENKFKSKESYSKEIKNSAIQIESSKTKERERKLC
jgi:hypothetical protein